MILDQDLILEEMEDLQAAVKAFKSEDFVGNRKEVATKCVQILKTLYDLTKNEEKKVTALAVKVKPLKSKKKQKKVEALARTEAPLDNLLVKGFENEQIWQEIQLQNSFMYENLVSSVSKLLAHQRYLKTVEKDEESDQSEDIDEDQHLDDTEAGTGDDPDPEAAGQSSDDDNPESDDEYQDTEKLSQLIATGEDESEEEDELEEEKIEAKAPEELSNFEKRRKHIEENIQQMEEDALEPKAWQFQGEVTAQSRPENSLLEEHLMFDHLIRQAPEMTTETTQCLEDIIKQRIKDQAWDDVERKVKPIDDPFAYKKKLVLNAEKSKMSLSQIYEQEYVEKKRSEEGEEKPEEVPPEHVEIQKRLDSLFRKLDALSNFHYTPKAISAEIKVVSNLPSISVEEVAPVTASDATLLAPQEIEAPTPAEIKGKAERSDTDRKRERRRKKKLQKLKRVAREEKARLKGLGLQNIKIAENLQKASKRKKNVEGAEGSTSSAKELKSSKAFFAKLQTQVDTHIKKVAEKKKKKEIGTLDPKKFKL